jgi:hypothetical protein
MQALLLKFPNIKTLELRLGWLTELSTSGNVRRLSVDKPKLKALRLIGLYEIDELEALLAVFGETLEYLRLDTSDPNPIVKLPEALVSSLSNDALIQAIGASNMALDYGPTIHEQLISSSEQLVGRHCRNLKKLIINEKEIY